VNAELLHQPIDLPSRDTIDIRLHHDRENRLLRRPAGLQKRREIRGPGPLLGDQQLNLPNVVFSFSTACGEPTRMSATVVGTTPTTDARYTTSTDMTDRAGRFVTQPTGYRAFIPEPLPPQPPVAMDAELMALLTQAERAIARLDGVVRVIPDPDFFVAMYVRREAVLSSQIEGTQSSLQDLLEAELDPARGLASDVGDIVNYVAAMNHGLERLEELPLSLRLIREIHAELLRGGRGGRATPGEFRTTQKWIGPAGAPLARATFVPPPPYEMSVALGNLETYLHRDERAPLLMEIGLTHAQFETVHPFLDGNGRVGRLLITFLLVHRGALRRPVRYLSHFFKLNRAEYYDRLMAIDSGATGKDGCGSFCEASQRPPTKRLSQQSGSLRCESNTARS